MFEEAALILEDVSDEFKTSRENVVQYASVFAGICGLDLIQLIDDSESLDGATPIAFFMSIFQEQTPEKIVACQEALNIIESNVSALAIERNEDENIAVMGTLMALMGSDLNERFDPDNDGVLNINHNDTCSTAIINDVDSALTGSYLSKLFAAAMELTAVEALTEIREQITTGCEGLSTDREFCSAIDPTTYTTAQILGVRSLLQEGQVFGMGSCTNSPNSLGNCICF